MNLNPDIYGRQYRHANEWRVRRIVDAFDRLVPGWFTRPVRTGTRHLGYEMACALERLVKERDALREENTRLKLQQDQWTPAQVAAAPSGWVRRALRGAVREAAVAAGFKVCE